MAFRSSGLKGKPKKDSVPEGISRTPLGNIRVRDKAYLSALHAARNVPPLRLGVADPVGVHDLHHAKNPTGKARRMNDAAVVKLDHAEHMEIDASDAPYNLAFGAWAALHYFSYKKGILEEDDRAQIFLKWVLEKLEEENG